MRVESRGRRRVARDAYYGLYGVDRAEADPPLVALHRQTGFRVEEVQALDVHVDLERLPLAGMRISREASHERDAGPTGTLRGQPGLRVLGSIGHQGFDPFFRRDRLPGNVEVNIDLGAHVLTDVAHDRHAAVLVRLREEGGVLHVLRSYSQDDLTALEAGKTGAPLQRGRVQP